MPTRVSSAAISCLLCLCLWAEAAASSAEKAAEVLYSRGDVRVLRGHEVLSAEKELELLADDEMVLGFDALLVVKLTNGHMVRIDEDLRLRVRDLALFGARPTTTSIHQQFEGLFSGAERTEVGERIVGYHGRRSAGESIGAQPTESARSRSVAEEQVRVLEDAPEPPAETDRPPSLPRRGAAEESRAAPSGERALPPPAPASEPAPSAVRSDEARPEAVQAEAVSESRRRRLLPQRRERSLGAVPQRVSEPEVTVVEEIEAEEPEPLASWAWGVVEKGSERLIAGALPDQLLSLLPSELDECLRGSMPDELSDRPLQTVSLLLRIENGRVTRVALGGGLPVPACSMAGLIDARLEIPELGEQRERYWVVVRVPLH